MFNGYVYHSRWNIFLFRCSTVKSGCGISKMKIILSSSELFHTQCSKESSKMITPPSVQFTLVPLTSIPQCVSGIFNPRCILSLRRVLAKYVINHLTFWPIIQKKGIPPGVSWSTMGYNPCVRIQNAPLGCASLT